MVDICNEIKLTEEDIDKDSITILKKITRELQKKYKKNFKLTFSKSYYKNNYVIWNAIEKNLINITDQENKIDNNQYYIDYYDEYKFEIYNENFKYRLFRYYHASNYPDLIKLDGGISEEINCNDIIVINNNKELIEYLKLILSNNKLHAIEQFLLNSLKDS